MSRKRKYTYEEARQAIENIGYKLVGDYIKNNNKITVVDEEQYYYIISCKNLLDGCKPQRYAIANTYTIQNIKTWMKNNNLQFELITTEYNGWNSKLTLKDKAEYYYEISLNSLLTGGTPCKFHCSNSYTLQNIIKWCEDDVDKKAFKLISEQYIGNDKKLQWFCFKCEEIFQCSLNRILSGGGCGICHGKQVGISNCLATKRPDLKSIWHPTENGLVTPYNITAQSRYVAVWQCQNNKDHTWAMQVSHMHTDKCQYCRKEDNNLLKVNPDLCKEWDYNKNKNNPEEYLSASQYKAHWICSKCNHKWRATISHRHNKNDEHEGRGCPRCCLSRGENRIRKWLDLHDIQYISQKKFKGLIGTGGGNLSYDFYLPDHNILIEFQGIQHAKPVDFISKGIKYDPDLFLKQIKHDEMKKDYAKNNNIKLIEIWYYDFAKVEQILNETFNLNKLG